MLERVHGKWILAGEHSVLRGSPALVFPVQEKYLEFCIEDSSQEFLVQIEGENSKEYDLLFWGLIEEALKKLNRSRSDLQGKMNISSQLPIGTGLGASAALCVGVSKYFEKMNWITNQELYEFARSLEDLFHGQSSGVDIAVALAGKPLQFSVTGDREVFSLSWQPNWAISYCGQRGVTSDCVRKVQSLIESQPDLGKLLDEQMKQAVLQAREALSLSREDGVSALKEALDKANDCFGRWGLISGPLKEHMSELKGAGAIAMKPTGSGEGGFVLSLWDRKAPEQVGDHPLIKLGPFE